METNNFIDENIVDLVYQGLSSIGITVHKLNIRRVLDGTCGIVGASNEQTINHILEMYMRIKSTAHECVDIPYITALHGSLGDAIPASGMLRAQPMEYKDKFIKTLNYDDVAKELQRISAIESAEDKAVAYFVYLTRAFLFKEGNMLVAQLIATKVLDESGIGYMDIPVDDSNFYRIVYNCIVTGQDAELSAYVKENCIKYCK